MTQNRDSSRDPPEIVPLRQRRDNGTLYTRSEGVESCLTVLATLPTSELVERARITDRDAPGYISSECVLYFVRHSREGDEGALFELFTILRKRILAAVPLPPRKLPGTSKTSDNVVDLEVQEAVLHKFQILLCKDRDAYEERLDYYEVRFNDALASLRATARRDARRDASRKSRSNQSPTQRSHRPR